MSCLNVLSEKKQICTKEAFESAFPRPPAVPDIDIDSLSQSLSVAPDVPEEERSAKLLQALRDAEVARDEKLKQIEAERACYKHIIGVIGPRRQGKSTLANRMFFGNSGRSPFVAMRGFRGVTKGIDLALTGKDERYPESIVLDSEGLFDENKSDDAVFVLLLFLCDVIIYNCKSNIDDSHIDSISRALVLYNDFFQNSPVKMEPKTLVIYLQGSMQGTYSDEEFASFFQLNSVPAQFDVHFRCTHTFGEDSTLYPHDLVLQGLEASNKAGEKVRKPIHDFYSVLSSLQPVLTSLDNQNVVNWDEIFSMQYPCPSTCGICHGRCVLSSVAPHSDSEHRFRHEANICCTRRCRRCGGPCVVKKCHSAGEECHLKHLKDRCQDIPVAWYLIDHYFKGQETTSINTPNALDTKE